MAISATGRPIDFVFDSRVGFSGTADRMDLLPVGPNTRGGRPPSNKISNDHISGMGYPIHFHELESSFGGISRVGRRAVAQTCCISHGSKYRKSGNFNIPWEQKP